MIERDKAIEIGQKVLAMSDGDFKSSIALLSRKIPVNFFVR